MVQRFNSEYKQNGLDTIKKNSFCFLESADYIDATNDEFIEVLKHKQFYDIIEKEIDINLLEKKIIFFDEVGKPICLDYFEILWLQNRSHLIDVICNSNKDSAKTIGRVYSKYLLQGITRVEGVSNFFNFDDPYSKIKINPIHDFYKSNIFSEFVYGSGYDKNFNDGDSILKLVRSMTNYISSIEDSDTQEINVLGRTIKNFIHISYKEFFCEKLHELAEQICQKYLSIYEKNIGKETQYEESFNILKSLMLPQMPLINSRTGCLRHALEHGDSKEQLIDYIEKDFAPKLARLYLEKNNNNELEKENIEKLKNSFYLHMVGKKDNAQVIDLPLGILSPLFMSLTHGLEQTASTIFTKIYDFYTDAAVKANGFYTKDKVSEQDVEVLGLSESGPLADMYTKLKFLLRFGTPIKNEETDVINTLGNNIAHLLFLSMPISQERKISQETKEFDLIKNYLDQTSSWHLLKEKNDFGMTPLDILNKRKHLSFDSVSYKVSFGMVNNYRSAIYDEFNSLTDKYLLNLEIKSLNNINVDKKQKI